MRDKTEGKWLLVESWGCSLQPSHVPKTAIQYAHKLTVASQVFVGLEITLLEGVSWFCNQAALIVWPNLGFAVE